MPRTKVSTTVYFTAEQFERLKALSARTKVPFAVYVRQGVDLALEKVERAQAWGESTPRNGQLQLVDGKGSA